MEPWLYLVFISLAEVSVDIGSSDVQRRIHDYHLKFHRKFSDEYGNDKTHSCLAKHPPRWDKWSWDAAILLSTRAKLLGQGENSLLQWRVIPRYITFDTVWLMIGGDYIVVLTPTHPRGKFLK